MRHSLDSREGVVCVCVCVCVGKGTCQKTWPQSTLSHAGVALLEVYQDVYNILFLARVYIYREIVSCFRIDCYFAQLVYGHKRLGSYL